MKRVWTLASLFVLTALAGCADDAPALEAEADFSDLDLEADADTGVIRGVVIDETITPVADATVALSDGTETTTTPEGLFGFSDLEPGTYFLTITKPGFGQIQQSTEVVAGVATPPIVKVQLVRTPGSEPFVVNHYYEAFMSCSFKATRFVFSASDCDPTGAAGYANSDDSAHTFETDSEQIPEWYQVEIDWEASQPLSSGLVTIQCVGDSPSCGSGEGSDRICNVRGASPLVCGVGRVSDEAPPGGGNNLTAVSEGKGFRGVYTVGLFSNCAYSCVPGTVYGAGVALEQSVFIYANVFYNYAPPEGWSFLQDGSYAPPS